MVIVIMLLRRDVYKSKVVCLSSLSLVLLLSSMVNVFGDNIASGPGKSASGEENRCNSGQFFGIQN